MAEGGSIVLIGPMASVSSYRSSTTMRHFENSHLPDRLSVQSRRHTFRAIIKVCDQLREDWNLGELADNGQPAISGWGPTNRRGIGRVRVQRSRPDVSARLVGKYGSLIAVEEGHYTTVFY